ncbi:MAG: hypothetical protein U0892_02010 [Pirellulales bacterium]
MVLRQRFWIDNQVQGVLIGRIVLYWFACVLYFGASSACFQIWSNPDVTVREHARILFDQAWPSIPSVLLILPLVLFDIVRLSNRFVGPIYRVKNHLAKLLANSNCYPLTFRDGDYWMYLADPINTLQQKIVQLEQVNQQLQVALNETQEKLSGQFVSTKIQDDPFSQFDEPQVQEPTSSPAASADTSSTPAPIAPINATSTPSPVGQTA